MCEKKCQLPTARPNCVAHSALRQPWVFFIAFPSACTLRLGSRRMTRDPPSVRPGTVTPPPSDARATGATGEHEGQPRHLSPERSSEGPGAPTGVTTLSLSDDAKKFASSLQVEILTRLETHSKSLDSLFDAEALKG